MKASWEEMVMIRPRPRAFIPGSTAWAATTVWKKCTSIRRRKVVSGNSSNGPRMFIPAFVTRMSGEPSAASAAAMKA